MKKIIKWISIAVASLLVLAVAFTAVFIVIPLSRSMKNLRERENELTTSAVTQAVTSEASGTEETAPAATEPEPPSEAQPGETTTAATEPEDVLTEYDIYRTGRFYAKGTVTDSDGETNPMELAVTDQSIYMLTSASGVQMGVMVGGGKTYRVSPEHKMYIELSGMVMSVLGMDADKLASPENFNFSGMLPLSAAESVTETELNGVACREYMFTSTQGKKTCIYMSGTKLLQTDMYNADGTLYNRMTFETVSAEVPADRIAPPTYYQKAGLWKFMSTITADLPR